MNLTISTGTFTKNQCRDHSCLVWKEGSEETESPTLIVMHYILNACDSEMKFNLHSGTTQWKGINKWATE